MAASCTPELSVLRGGRRRGLPWIKFAYTQPMEPTPEKPLLSLTERLANPFRFLSAPRSVPSRSLALVGLEEGSDGEVSETAGQALLMLPSNQRAFPSHQAYLLFTLTLDVTGTSKQDGDKQ